MTPLPPRLRIGKVRGVTLTKWQGVWGQRFDVPLEVCDVEDADPLAGIHDGSLDLCFVRLPIDRAGLHAIPLYEEQVVAWVSKDHAIAAVDEVTLADLDDEQVLTEAGPGTADLLLAGVVLRVPMSIARAASRRDLTYRPVVDAAPVPVALVWREDDENPLIQEFIGVVRGRTANSSRGAGTGTGGSGNGTGTAGNSAAPASSGRAARTSHGQRAERAGRAGRDGHGKRGAASRRRPRRR